MRINQYISSPLLLQALVVWAGEGTEADPASLTLHATEKKPWSLRIRIPVGSDYFIKTSGIDGEINFKENPDDIGFGFGDTAAMITGQKKIKTEYHVVAQMDLDASKNDWKFWVGRGENTDAPVEELQKCDIWIENWPENDMTVWLGPDYSAVTMNKCDSLNVGWLKCFEHANASDAWNNVYFKEPEIPDQDSAGKCAGA